MRSPHSLAIPSPLGLLRLRSEEPRDQDFRFRLFCDSRLPEWYRVCLEPAVREALMRMQFESQTTTYAQRFPRARFDIIELEGEPIGRIVVNRPGPFIHIVDHAIVPSLRNRGLGTAIMLALMDEAAAASIPMRLKVADANDPSLKLYRRLGFTPIEEAPFYIELEWTAPHPA
ncbi:MAG TPA: GNAT family N-acetyltransferase [Beijerinckiaceae bacterium]|jgi:RimJ/RimL family protein N-acetyltransferase